MIERQKIKVNFCLPKKDFMELEWQKLDVTLHIPNEVYEKLELLMKQNEIKLLTT